MRHTIIYKYLDKLTFKNVEAETEEEAKKLLCQELLDIYKGWCVNKNKQFLMSDFNRKYKIQ